MSHVRVVAKCEISRPRTYHWLDNGAYPAITKGDASPASNDQKGSISMYNGEPTHQRKRVKDYFR